MLRIEFPTASPADVTGPQAPDLRADARALLGARYTQNNTRTRCLFISWDMAANYAPIITLFDFSTFSNGGRPEFIYLRVY